MSSSLPLIRSNPTGALKVAYDGCKFPDPLGPEDIELLQTRRKQLREKKDGLFAIESSAILEIEESIREVEHLLANPEGLPILDHDAVFGMRDKHGLPLVVPFPHDEKEVSFNGTDWGSSHNSLPQAISSHYRDVSEKLSGRITFFTLLISTAVWFWTFCAVLVTSIGFAIPHANTVVGLLVIIISGVLLFFAIMGACMHTSFGTLTRTKHQRMTAKYSGVIPSEIRQLIKDSTSKYKHIVILAEVRNWEIKMVSVPLIDPLVIGYKPNSGKWYVLATYDTTPLEEYIRQEFTT